MPFYYTKQEKEINPKEPHENCNWSTSQLPELIINATEPLLWTCEEYGRDQIVPMASSIQRSRPFWNYLLCKTPQISMKLCRCGPERWILIPRNFRMTAWLPGLSPRGVTQESNHTPTQQSPDDLIDANRIQNPAMPSSNALMQSPLFPKGMNSISTNSISQTTFVDCSGVHIQQNNKLDSKAWMHTSDATLGKFNPKFPAETQTP